MGKVINQKVFLKQYRLKLLQAILFAITSL